MKKLLTILCIVCNGALFAQKNISVVEVFCNTGNYSMRDVLPNFKLNAGIADTSEKNYLYIQYNVPKTYNNWTDMYANSNNEQLYNTYLSKSKVDSISGIVINGQKSKSTPWSNCAPIERDVYSTGAKTLSLSFESYDSITSTAVFKYIVSSKSLTGKSVHAVESGISVNVTGGDNAGQTFVMDHVARAFRIKASPSVYYYDTVQIKLPKGMDFSQTRIMAYMQDDKSLDIVAATRGFILGQYIQSKLPPFAVVEMFCNSGCYGGPPAISSMYAYAAEADTNSKNHALIQLHIYQTYGNWNDIYTLDLNNKRYDKYSISMGILAGLAAVSKNGIRYYADVWNSCKPQEKKALSKIDLTQQSYIGNQLVLNYQLGGVLNPHDKVYFYVVENDITVSVTGAEIAGTTLHMNHVARVGRTKDIYNTSDTVLLQIPTDADKKILRVLAYIQNDVTYDITGGNKGFALGASSNGISNAISSPDFSIFPNPTHDAIQISLTEFKDVSNLSVNIYNTNGQLVYTKKLNDTPSLFVVNDHLLSPGIYMIQVQSSQQSLVKKLEIF